METVRFRLLIWPSSANMLSFFIEECELEWLKMVEIESQQAIISIHQTNMPSARDDRLSSMVARSPREGW